MRKTLLTIITVLGLAGLQAHADRLVIKGSDTLGAKLVPQLAEAFKASHPDTTFDIAAEGSTTGIAAIIDGYGANWNGQSSGEASGGGHCGEQRCEHETDDRGLRWNRGDR